MNAIDILKIVLLIVSIIFLIISCMNLVYALISNYHTDKMIAESIARIRAIQEKETTSEEEKALDPSSFDDDFDDIDIDFKTD